MQCGSGGFIPADEYALIDAAIEATRRNPLTGKKDPVKIRVRTNAQEAYFYGDSRYAPSCEIVAIEM